MPSMAGLIIRGLDGEHLHGFLPGNDRRGAVSRVVASKHEWSGPGYCCAVTRDGIGEWATVRACMAGRRAAAVTFVTWAEVLAVIERGCAGGCRERYEAAYGEWCAGVHAAHDGWKPGDSWFPETPNTAAIHEATAALIRHGCGQLEVQDALF